MKKAYLHHHPEYVHRRLFTTILLNHYISSYQIFSRKKPSTFLFCRILILFTLKRKNTFSFEKSTKHISFNTIKSIFLHHFRRGFPSTFPLHRSFISTSTDFNFILFVCLFFIGKVISSTLASVIFFYYYYFKRINNEI